MGPSSHAGLAGAHALRSRRKRSRSTDVDRSKLAVVAVAALVVLAIITLIVSEAPGPIDPYNPPPATQPVAP